MTGLGIRTDIQHTKCMNTKKVIQKKPVTHISERR